jgi:hypothetical protein
MYFEDRFRNAYNLVLNEFKKTPIRKTTFKKEEQEQKFDLSIDIINSILHLCDVDDYCRLQLVCKQFHRTINSDTFCLLKKFHWFLEKPDNDLECTKYFPLIPFEDDSITYFFLLDTARNFGSQFMSILLSTWRKPSTYMVKRILIRSINIAIGLQERGINKDCVETNVTSIINQFTTATNTEKVEYAAACINYITDIFPVHKWTTRGHYAISENLMLLFKIVCNCSMPDCLETRAIIQKGECGPVPPKWIELYKKVFEILALHGTYYISCLAKCGANGNEDLDDFYISLLIKTFQYKTGDEGRSYIIYNTNALKRNGWKYCNLIIDAVLSSNNIPALKEMIAYGLEIYSVINELEKRDKADEFMLSHIFNGAWRCYAFENPNWYPRGLSPVLCKWASLGNRIKLMGMFKKEIFTEHAICAAIDFATVFNQTDIIRYLKKKQETHYGNEINGPMTRSKVKGKRMFTE